MSGPVAKAFDHALIQTRARRATQNASCCRVLSSSPMFNRWLDRSHADLQIMLTDTPHGAYPYAGIPWFSTPFGRDGLITAFELLWVNPAIARGVLAFLAETQATSQNDVAGCPAGQDPSRDARRRDGGARRGAVRPLLRQLRCDAAVRDARPRLLPAHRRSRVHRPDLAEHRGRSRLDANERRPRRGRLHRLRAEERRRPDQPGMEGLARFHLPRRRDDGRGSDRVVRGAGLCLRGVARRRATGRAARRQTRGQRVVGARRAAARALRADLLVRGARHVRAGARRPPPPVPRAHLQPGPLPVLGDRRSPNAPSACATR